MICIYVYTMVYTITSFLHSSPTASLSPAAPLVQRCSRSCFIVWSALASFSQSLFTPLLSLTLQGCPRPQHHIQWLSSYSLLPLLIPTLESAVAPALFPKRWGRQALQGGMLQWYVTHSGASASSLNRSLWPCSSTASCSLAFNR